MGIGKRAGHKAIIGTTPGRRVLLALDLPTAHSCLPGDGCTVLHVVGWNRDLPCYPPMLSSHGLTDIWAQLGQVLGRRQQQ
jgi:hypothetical protein